MAYRRRDSDQALCKPHAFDDQEQPVKEAPDDERPVRTVPEAAQEEHEDEIEIQPSGGRPVSAEWDIDVVAEPGGERHVPSPPEVLDRLGDIRIVEILREMKPEHATETDCHV